MKTRLGLLIIFAAFAVGGIWLTSRAYEPPARDHEESVTTNAQVILPEQSGHGEFLLGTPMLGIVIDEEMRVVSVDPKSAAEKSGIQAGDLLLSIMAVYPDGTHGEAIPFSPETSAAAQQVVHGTAAYYWGNQTDMGAPPLPTQESLVTPNLETMGDSEPEEALSAEPGVNATATPEIIIEAVITVTLEPYPTVAPLPTPEPIYGTVKLKLERDRATLEIDVTPDMGPQWGVEVPIPTPVYAPYDYF